ncbi:MAG: hypothetical protein HQ591_04725 [candidate division Zixibacteria bacterium]|nr:hypothetical protein [Candidatus Tariuqbacter arcticus]
MQYKDTIIKVSLFGASGRMGKEVANALQDESDFQIRNLIEKKDHPSVGSILFDVKISGTPFDLPLADTVFCDFTDNEAAVKNAALAAEMECPILISSTGFSREKLDYLHNLGEKIPVMIAPNLSRGVDLLYRLTELSAKAVGDDFEVEIMEAHHKWKMDAPSGTARELVRILEKFGAYQKIPTHSLRMGDIVGEHRLIFGGEGETISIVHRAHSRRAFAKGAPAALRFLAKAIPGVYNFRQALGD